MLLAVAVGIGLAAYLAARGPVEEAVREITLPLKHEDIIRQQARDKDLDPALIAAVYLPGVEVLRPHLRRRARAA